VREAAPYGQSREPAEERATIRTEHGACKLSLLDWVGGVCTFRGRSGLSNH
jgi:hypothetical protein